MCSLRPSTVYFAEGSRSHSSVLSSIKGTLCLRSQCQSSRRTSPSIPILSPLSQGQFLKAQNWVQFLSDSPLPPRKPFGLGSLPTSTLWRSGAVLKTQPSKYKGPMKPSKGGSKEHTFPSRHFSGFSGTSAPREEKHSFTKSQCSTCHSFLWSSLCFLTWY